MLSTLPPSAASTANETNRIRSPAPNVLRDINHSPAFESSLFRGREGGLPPPLLNKQRLRGQAPSRPFILLALLLSTSHIERVWLIPSPCRKPLTREAADEGAALIMHRPADAEAR